MECRNLRHTPGTLSALEKNREHALLHFRSSSIFTFIPKNACTSLRTSLGMANGLFSDTADWSWVHNNNSTFSANLADLAVARNTAVILRCPFSRLASAFLDKIVSRNVEFWSILRRSGDSFDIDSFSFRDFTSWLSHPGALRSDAHWRPQIEFLAYQEYDRVFDFRNLSDFASYFFEVTGHPFVDARSLSKNTTSYFSNLPRGCYADTSLAKLSFEKSRGHLPKPEDLYDASIIKDIRNLYALDFSLYQDFFGDDSLLF